MLQAVFSGVCARVCGEARGIDAVNGAGPCMRWCGCSHLAVTHEQSVVWGQQHHCRGNGMLLCERACVFLGLGECSWLHVLASQLACCDAASSCCGRWTGQAGMEVRHFLAAGLQCTLALLRYLDNPLGFCQVYGVVGGGSSRLGGPWDASLVAAGT